MDAHGAQVFELPVKPFYEDDPDPTSAFGYRAAGYASYHLRMEQPLTLTAGQAVRLVVYVYAFIQSMPPGSTESAPILSAPAGGAGGVTLGMLPRISEVTIEVQLWPGTAGGQPEYRRYLQPDQPPTQYGRQAEFSLEGTFTPTGTTYRFVIAISGRYLGQIPPIRVTTAVVSVA